MSSTSYDGLWRMVSHEEIVLPDGTKKKILLRSVGRDDGKARRAFAREQANLARLKLLDSASDEHRDALGWIGTADNEALERIVRKWYATVLANEAKEEIVVLEDADEEQPVTLVDSLEKEEHDKGVEEEAAVARQKYVDANIEQRIAGTLSDRNGTEAFVKRVMMESYCLDVHNRAWDDATLFYGVLNEDGTQFFDEIPANADKNLIALLHSMYRRIDEGSYRPSS